MAKSLYGNLVWLLMVKVLLTGLAEMLNPLLDKRGCPGKDKVIVQDSKNFTGAASELISTTKIIHVEADEIENVKRTDTFNNVKPVKGISSSHIISVYNDCLCGAMLCFIILFLVITPQTWFAKNNQMKQAPVLTNYPKSHFVMWTLVCG